MHGRLSDVGKAREEMIEAQSSRTARVSGRMDASWLDRQVESVERLALYLQRKARVGNER